jgi:transposase
VFSNRAWLYTNGMERRYALRDAQWERLRQLGLPGESGHVGVTAKDNRLFVEAVLYRFRAGIPWRDLPAHFGNWHRVYVRFNRWSKQGIWQRIFEQLSRDSNNEYAMIDATVVRAHRSAAGARKKGEMPMPRKCDRALAAARAA